MDSKYREKCPGQSTQIKTPDEMVYSVACPKCKYEIEFFYDDVERPCKDCGELVIGKTSKLENLGCAEWCKEAEKCLGTELYEKVKKRKN